MDGHYPSRTKTRTCSSSEELAAFLDALAKRIDLLEYRLAALEAELALIEGMDANAEALAAAADELEVATRRALRQLHNPALLITSDLAQIVYHLTGNSSSAQELQSMLRGGIRMLRPAQDTADLNHHFYFEILHLTYIEGRHADDIAAQLDLSRRQYYRELKTAIRALAEYLLTSCYC